MIRFVFLLLALIGMAFPASAEFYQYKDSNGVIVFTDDPGEIPLEKRQAARRFEEEIRPDKGNAPEVKPETIKAVKKHNRVGQDTNGPDSFASLQDEKAALDQLYQELIDRRNALRKREAEGLKPGQDSIDHKKKADALNADIAAFDQRRQAYEARVSRFNKAQQE